MRPQQRVSEAMSSMSRSTVRRNGVVVGRDLRGHLRRHRSESSCSPAAAGHLREHPAQQVLVHPVRSRRARRHDVGGDLRPGPEVAVPGVHVGVGDVVAVGVGPDRVEGRDDPRTCSRVIRRNSCHT